MPACGSSRPVRRVSSQQSRRVRQRRDGARRQVAEVADRGGDEHQRAGHSPASRTSTTSPTRSPQRSNAPAWPRSPDRARHTGTPTRWRRIRTVLITTPSRRRTRRRAGSACRSCAPTGSAVARARLRCRPTEQASALRAVLATVSQEASTRPSVTNHAMASALHVCGHYHSSRADSARLPHPPQRSFKPRRRGLSPSRTVAYERAM